MLSRVAGGAQSLKEAQQANDVLRTEASSLAEAIRGVADSSEQVLHVTSCLSVSCVCSSACRAVPCRAAPWSVVAS
jgi:hypothetical protein